MEENSVLQDISHLCQYTLIAQQTSRTSALERRAKVRKLKPKLFSALFSQLGGPLKSRYSQCNHEKPDIQLKLQSHIAEFKSKKEYENAHRFEKLTGNILNDAKSDYSEEVLCFLLHLANSVHSKKEVVLGKKVFTFTSTEPSDIPLENTSAPVLYKTESVQRKTGFQYYMQFSNLNFHQHNQDHLLKNGFAIENDLFHELPGAGLKFFCPDFSCMSSKPEKKSSDLFGALHQSRVTTINVSLSLPELSDNMELNELKIPKLVFPERDEGYESTLSSPNVSDPLSIDSGRATLDDCSDIWTKALKFTNPKVVSWETIGKGLQVKPYITEAGLDVLNKLNKVYLQTINVFENIQTGTETISMQRLLDDIRYMLLGVPSKTFEYIDSRKGFKLKPHICVNGISPHAIEKTCENFIQCGSNYLFLESFGSQIFHQHDSDSNGYIFQAFCDGINRFLQYYRAQVLSIKTHSLLHFSALTRKLMEQVLFLTSLCKNATKNGGTPLIGTELLSYLYEECLDASNCHYYPVLLSLLHSTARPFLLFIFEWVFYGKFRDNYGEFEIQMDEVYLEYRDQNYWQFGFKMPTEAQHSTLPLFLRHLRDDVFISGKSLNLLKLISPDHFLFKLEKDRPQLQLTFSDGDLQTIETECKVYETRMMEVFKHHQYARKQKALMESEARQQIIRNARQTAFEKETILMEKMMEKRLMKDNEKRKLFAQLKQQMETDKTKRKLDKDTEKNEDKERMKQSQNMMTLGVEKHLEEEAKKEMMEYYSKLSEEATKREQRALWHVRRLQLHAARQEFLHKTDIAEEAELLMKPMPQRQIVEDSVDIENLKRQYEASWKEVKELSSYSRKPVKPVLTQDQSDAKTLLYPGQDSARNEQIKQSIQGMLYPFSSLKSDSNISSESSKSLREKDSTAQYLLYPDNSNSMDEKKVSSRGVKLVDSSIQSLLYSSNETAKQSNESSNFTAKASSRGIKIEDSSMKSVIYPKDDVEISDVITKPSTRGIQVEDSSLKAVIYPIDNESTESIKPSTRGIHIEDSALKSVIYPVHDESEDSVKPSTRGIHIEDSSLKSVIYPVQNEGIESIKISTRGVKTTDSSLKNVLYPSDISEKSKEHDLFAPKLKHREGYHASVMSDWFSYQVKRVRKTVPNMNVNATTEPALPKYTTKNTKGSHVSDLSVPDNRDVYRLQKFRETNIYGHASDSSAQKLLYGHSTGDGLAVIPIERSLLIFQRESQVLPYDDEFSILNGSPSIDLLAGCVTANRDMSPELNDDITAHEYVCLSELMRRSITAPLKVQIDIVNQSVLDLFYEEYHVKSHIEALRTYLLMEDGQFGHCLCNELFEKLAEKPTAVQFFNPIYLNSVLNRAILNSVSGGNDYNSNLSFVLQHQISVLKHNSSSALAGLQLTYEVDWPVNIVLTDESLQIYGKLFSFMMLLKRVTWSLKDVWHKLKRCSIIKGGHHGMQFHTVHLYRHEMEHFVKVMQGYIANQVIYVSWMEFQENLQKVKNLNDLCFIHMRYLIQTESRCLLNKKAEKVKMVMNNLFDLILKFHEQLIQTEWYTAENGELQSPNYKEIANTYSSFKEYSKFLFKVISKLAIRGYHSHLQELILRLNYNGQYSKT